MLFVTKGECMKFVVVSICLFAIAFNAAADELKIQNVLEQNLANVTGTLKGNPDVSCGIEISDKIIPNGFGMGLVVNEDYENGTVLLYSIPGPAEGNSYYWELEPNAVVSYGINRETSIKLIFDSETLKITEFAYFKDFGSTETQACLFE